MRSLQIMLSAALCLWSWAAPAQPTTAPITTPRLADGKPDLSGYWGRLIGDGATIKEGDHIEGGGSGTVSSLALWLKRFEQDAQLNSRAQTNRPVYKPEHWPLIRQTDWNYSRRTDPQGKCLPSMPRLGIPQRIVQLPDEMIFFYETLNRFRIVPTDGRARDPIKSANPTWFGDAVAHWEGDTLVIETISIVDQSWLGQTGYVHSEDIKVTERVRREGNTLHWQTTVADPMLLQPWQMNPLTAQRNANPKATLWEELPCDERDNEALGDSHEGR